MILGTERLQTYPLPPDTGYANLNTAAFDANGVLWFTGQSGIYGRLNPGTGQLRCSRRRAGRGPYGIVTTPDGDVYYALLAGSHIARIDTESGEATVLEPPTAGQGVCCVWSDSAEAHLGQRMERRTGGCLRPGRRDVARAGGCPATGHRLTQSLLTNWTKSG